MATVTERNLPEAVETSGGGRSNPFMIVPISLFFLLLIIAVLRSPSLVTPSGIGSAIIVATPLILATYALMASVITGRGTVDLSIGPLIGFINVTVIVAHGAGFLTNPFSLFLFAFALGMAYHLLFALIVVFVRVQPIIVALSGYLALSGINLVILPRPGGVAPEWMSTWGAGTTIFSPVLVILVLATLAWLAFTRSAFYTHLRLMGSDERAAYTSGVSIALVRIGGHLISGLFAALAAITFTALISSGDPTQGTTYTLIAVTALVLGGASLAGGRAGVFGSALGAINLYLITYVLATFSFGMVQSFVTDLAYGAILVGSLLVTLLLPVLQRYIRRFSPLLYFVVLGVVVFGVIMHATFDYAGAPADAVVATDESASQPAIMQLERPPAGEVLTGPLEVADGGEAAATLREFARPLIHGVLLLAAVALLLRVTITTAGQRRDWNVVVLAIAAALMLLVAYVISDVGGDSDPPTQEQETSR